MNINIGLEDIQQKDEMKLLGDLIDSDLNFSKHTGHVCRKASRQIDKTRQNNFITLQHIIQY